MASRKTASDNELLARLDERTVGFTKTLDFMAAENRELSKAMLAALQKHAGDDDTRFAKHGDTAEKHDGRIRTLENWRWYIVGTIAAVGYLVWLLK